MSAVLDHLSLGVGDIERSRVFYDAALAPLGCRRLFDHPYASGYDRAAGKALAFWIVQYGAAQAGPGLHICFAAPSREAVDAFYAASLAHGGADDGKPGLRPQYHADYYAAFVRDPDGHKIEAVHHQPE